MSSPADPAATTRRPDRRGLVAALALTAVLFVVSVRRWAELHAGASDLGIFDQALWLMSRGHAPFVTTIGINVFADHVSAVLLLLVPLYRVAAGPMWLLLLQAACLGLTVVPVRRLADDIGVGRGWATVLVVANPFVWNAALYDFHPVVLATPAVAWLLLSVRRDRTGPATAAALLVVACRADAAMALLGAVVVAGERTRRRMLWLAPLPLILAAVLPRLLGTWQTFERYYGRLGDSPIDAVTHPWRLATVVPTALFQMAVWLLPAGFLPLRRWRWVVALAVAGLPLLLSSWGGIAEPWWHHGAVLVPFVAGGALAALAAIPPGAGGGERIRRVRLDHLRIVAGTTAALVCVGPLSPWSPDEVRMPDVLSPASPAVARAVAEVRPGESVSTTNDVAAHLARRDEVFIWPCPFPEPVAARRCSHPNLFPRADGVDVVVLPRTASLAGLPGHWQVRHVDGITVARRA